MTQSTMGRCNLEPHLLGPSFPHPRPPHHHSPITFHPQQSLLDLVLTHPLPMPPGARHLLGAALLFAGTATVLLPQPQQQHPPNPTAPPDDRAPGKKPCQVPVVAALHGAPALAGCELRVYQLLGGSAASFGDDGVGGCAHVPLLGSQQAAVLVASLGGELHVQGTTGARAEAAEELQAGDAAAGGGASDGAHMSMSAAAAPRAVAVDIDSGAGREQGCTGSY